MDKILNIYDSICKYDINNYINNINENILIEEKEVNNYFDIYLNNSSFFDKRIVEYIKLKYKNKYVIQYNNIILNYYYINKRDININEIYIFILIIDIICNLYNRNNIIKIHYIPTKLKKIFPKKFEALNSYYCNSGFTNYTYNKDLNGEILIYRKEESYKVLIHELLHSIHIDHNLVLNKSYDKINNYNNIFNVNNNINFNETLVEVYAEILNIILMIYFKNKNINLFNKYIKKEIKYSFLKMDDILKYYKINNIKKILKNNPKSIKFIQYTNVISYYIIKPFILKNYNIFLDLLDNKYKLKNNIEMYENIQMKLYNEFNEYKIKNKKYLNKSLKMTIIKISNKNIL